MKEYILDSLKNNKEVLALYNNEDISSGFEMKQALVIAASYHLKPRPILYVANNLYNAQRMYERLISILNIDDCVLFGVEDSLRVEAIASSPELMANQVETLAKVIEDNKRIVVCNSMALVRYLPNIDVFKESCIDLKTDMQISTTQE